MVRNSTKILFASVVLGVMNQACAVNGGHREGIPTAPLRVTLAPSSDLALPARPVLPGRLESDPAMPRNLDDVAELVPASGGSRPAPLDRYPPLRLVAADESAGNGNSGRWRDAPMPTNGGVAVPGLTDNQANRVNVRIVPIGRSGESATGIAPVSPARALQEGSDLARADRVTETGDRKPQDVPPTAAGPVRDPATTTQTAPTPPMAALPPDNGPAPSDGQRPKSDKVAASSLWHRMRAGFAMPNLDSPLVNRHIEWYRNRPDYVQRIVERGRRYMHFIVEEVEKRGMPLEIALLPMIESAYNPTAYSKAHASGIWQFIPATGRLYGLQQNWWYDGRRDVTAATRAALDYLEKLHLLFGDWQLALAAYNWGEGAVTRAIERNQRKGLPTDYESLKMPAETRNYLPKLQAVKNIITEPERYGMPLEEVPNEPYFIRVAAPGSIDFKRAAQLAETPLEEFRSLNPAHNRPVIGPTGDGSLLIPAEKAEAFNANLSKAMDGTNLVSWQTYRLERNEKLEAIAARFGTTAANLRLVNGIGPRNKLKVGSTILVPLSAGDARKLETAALDVADFQPPETVAEAGIYRAKAGDTLYSIATRHGVSVQELMEWNRMRTPKVHAGQRISLKATTSESPAKVVRHGSKSRHADRVATTRAPAKADRHARIAQKVEKVAVRERQAARSPFIKASCCAAPVRSQHIARR